MTASTLLIVDDDSSFLRVLEYQLKQAGYDVLKAEKPKYRLGPYKDLLPDSIPDSQDQEDALLDSENRTRSPQK